MAKRTHLAPTGRLAGYVGSIVVASARAAEAPYLRLPNGEVELVARVGANDVLLHVIGARTSAVTKTVERGTVHAAAIRFKPGGAYPFFGVPIAELTDRGLPLSALWGDDAKRLADALAAAPSALAAAAQLEAALVSHLDGARVFEPAASATVRRAVRRMAESSEPPRVDALARELGISGRNLRRVFHDVVGVGPKTFARIVRFQRALAAARSAPLQGWGEIAIAAGYYDQSHLIADFRELAGTTPAALVGVRDQAWAAQASLRASSAS